MRPYRDLAVLQASQCAADKVNRLIDGSAGRGLLHVRQLRESTQSITANIAEGFGRGEGDDRARFLRFARGSAEETIAHLSANYRAQRVDAKTYWAIRNVLVVTVKMLDSFLSH